MTGPMIVLELRSIPITSVTLRRQTQTSGPRLRGFLCIDPTLSTVCFKEFSPQEAHGWFAQFTLSERRCDSSSDKKNNQRFRAPFVTGWAGILPARAIARSVDRATPKNAAASTGPIGHSAVTPARKPFVAVADCFGPDAALASLFINGFT